ncbi:MAG: N-acetyl-gamma-glutamyl-phosphate reductase [Clostridiaceae bacterium]|nr:N-acetyl-gamma-glutamyl-phosphate reductase [Clostridiaceae bacterium]
MSHTAASLGEALEPIRVGVAGATGYVGMELIRLLLLHPAFELVMAGSQSYAGQSLSEYNPALTGQTDLVLTAAGPEEFAANCDLVITALPHGVSSAWVSKMHGRGIVLLDHSGDFRFKDLALYEKTYKLTHPCPELLEQAVYGWPEQYRDELKTADLIANPGCYPTCSLTPLVPLLEAGLIEEDSIIIDAYSGTSGAGRSSDPLFSFSEMAENLKPYGVTGHRHQAEIREQLLRLSGNHTQVIFTPHLAPIRRGMLASMYVRPKPGIELSQAELTTLLQDYYKEDCFVRVLSGKQLPQTRPLIGTNHVDIAAVLDQETGCVKLFSALDNLGKGAAAQAIQALNCRYGFPEDTGLTMLPQFI